MNIKVDANSGGTNVSLYAKERRLLEKAASLCYVLNHHDPSEIAASAQDRLRELLDRYKKQMGDTEGDKEKPKTEKKGAAAVVD